ncbi:MAG: ABC transporter permease [Phycisphaerae bacterium]
MRGFWAIFLKEFAHIRRERSTLMFALAIPVLQLTIFGFAIDMKIEQIRTVVLDLDGRQASRELVAALRNTRVFDIVGTANDDDQFERAVRSGAAQVAVRIPPDFTEQRVRGAPATVQLLIDGSNSNVATAALNAAKLVGIQLSLEAARQRAEATRQNEIRDDEGRPALAVDVRPRLLYNPNLESAYFFVPALVGIILQNVTLFLTALSVVREREHGTLEQLFVTPVGRAGLLFGKLVPYTLLGFAETLLVLLVMVFLFGVPIAGNLLLLLMLSLLFVFTALGLGLLISTIAHTQLQAIQLTFLIMLPSILLSGFVFPRETMPAPIYWISFAIPVTYFLEILRGIILRAADLRDLMPHIAGLAACGVAILGFSLARFRKQLD